MYCKSLNVYLKTIPPEHLAINGSVFLIGEILFVMRLNVPRYGLCDIPITKPKIEYCERIKSKRSCGTWRVSDTHQQSMQAQVVALSSVLEASSETFGGCVP